MPSIFLLPLIWTVIVEMAVGYILGYRSKNRLMAIFFMNCITNPILNGILYFERFHPFPIRYLWLVLILELCVFIGE